MAVRLKDHLAARPIKFSDIMVLFANAVGIILYLLVAARGWRIPEEHGMVPVTGEPFVWVLALPILGFFFLLNVVYGLLALYYRRPETKKWWYITMMSWLVAVVIDFLHH